ncbi:gerM protein [Mycoplasma sp. CAG:776]|nr:gerM protein [Mycoplasma sp. CAG:776]
MLKKSALRRIMVSTLALVIAGVLYFFPNNEENIPLVQNIEYVSANETPIYLLNPDLYVVRTNMATQNTDSLQLIKELVEGLTIGNDKKEYISEHFSQIIPKNTKIIDISLENGLLKLNFSKELLNVSKDLEEKMIEAIVYTLTEVKGVDEIMIFVEGSKLEMLPQSNVKLPNTLDRGYGINKVYDITSIKDLTKTTVYYIGEFDDFIYYVPVTKISNEQEQNKIEIIIDELKSSPIYETNLMSYLASSVELENYEELENQITLSFNNAIFDDFDEKNILEEVKYSISLSIQDTLNVDEVIFKVDDEIIETFKEK